MPVGATIARAYRFAFSDFFKILGVMWLPMAIMWLPGIFMRHRMMELSAQLTAHNFSGFGAMMWFLVPFYLVALVLMFMQVIGIAQIALDRRKGPVWFYFWLGRPVWRLIGSFLLLIVAFVIGWIAVLLGGLFIGFLLGLISKAVNNSVFGAAVAVLTGLAFIVLWCGYFYSLIRLTFLLVPVVAAEADGFALARSWALGLRNFWRMFVILLATLGPFIVLEFALIFGFMVKGMPFPPPQASVAQKAVFQAAMNARMLEIMNAMYHYWYMTYPLMIAVIVVLYGLCTGAQCFAYRALTEGEASAPVAGN